MKRSGPRLAADGAIEPHTPQQSPWSLRVTDAPVGAPGTTRTCDLGIRRPLLYPPELRRQCAGQSIESRKIKGRRRHNAPEKSLSKPEIGYGVSLDTRTTPAGHRPLTATRRVPDVEGVLSNVYCKCDCAVLASGCRGVAPGRAARGRCPGYIPGGCGAAAWLAFRRWLDRRVAGHRVPAARADRARLVPGRAAVDQPGRHHVGRPARGPRAHRCPRDVVRV